jgi:hypothetical protein
MTIEATSTDDFPSKVPIDPDCTVSFRRPAVGGWVRFEVCTRFAQTGRGSAEPSLWDVEGQIGRPVQNPVVELSP